MLLITKHDWLVLAEGVSFSLIAGCLSCLIQNDNLMNIVVIMKTIPFMIEPLQIMDVQI